MLYKQKHCSCLGTCMDRQWYGFRHGCLWGWLPSGTFCWMVKLPAGLVRRPLLCWHPFSGCFMFRFCLRPLQKQYKILRVLVPSSFSLFFCFPSFKAEKKNLAFLILLAEFKDVMIILFQEKLSASNFPKMYTEYRCSPKRLVSWSNFKM